MRKTILLAAIATMGITSCSENEVIIDQGTTDMDNVLVFRPVIGKQIKTRVAEITSATLQNDSNGYKSEAYVTEAGFAANTKALTAYFNETMKCTDGVWAGSKTLYWPGAGKMSVFSYYPCVNNKATTIAYTGATYENATLTYPSLAFQASTVLADQVDLLAANDMDKAKTETETNLNVNFKHILSQLYFKAKAADDSYKVRVKSISVVGATQSATFTYKGSSGANDPVGTWSATPNAQEYKYRENVFPADATDPDPQTYIGNAATTIESEGNNGSLMIIPQAAGDAFKLTVTYDIYTSTNYLLAENVVKSAQMDELAMGKKYAYVLTLPSDGATTPVTFSVEVSGWDAEETVEQSYATYRLGATAAQYGTDIASAVNEFNTFLNGKIGTYTHTLKIAETATSKLNAALAIDLTAVLATNLGAEDAVVLDFTALTTIDDTNTVTVTPGDNWEATPASLTDHGTIKLTKKVIP